MNDSILKLFSDISWAGVAALAIWFIIKPLIELLIEKLSGGNSLGKRLDGIENNHLQEVNRRLNSLEECDLRYQKDIIEIRERITRIEAQLNSIKK